MIKVLIVDDSKFMRINLTKIISSDSNIEVVDTARNGIEALKLLKENPVDVIVLDFFMPKMDGLETLKQIMNTTQTPTIMITIANESEHADLYFKAIKMGAFDIISKPSGLSSLYIEEIQSELIKKIHFAANSREKMKVQFENTKKIQELVNQKKPVVSEKYKELDPNLAFQNNFERLVPPFKLIILGASTGGPPRIFELVKNLHFHPRIALMVIQHMPEGFTHSFAERLNQISEYEIHEASHGEILQPGHGYVAPGDYHIKLLPNKEDILIILNKEDKIWGIRPCIDYFMINAAPIFKNKCIGIILTGMGKDGAFGISKIKSYDGITFAQDLNEAVISSMPSEAIRTGLVDFIFPIQGIVNKINTIIT